MTDWIRKDLRLAIIDRDDGRCVYCGSRKHLSLDHLRPRSRAGNNLPKNLVTACLTCNKTRGTKPWWKFAENSEVIRRVRRTRRRGIIHRRKRAKRILASMSWNDAIAFIQAKRR